MKIKKGAPIGFIVIEPENLKFHYVPFKEKTKQKKKNYTPKKKGRRRTFAYVWRDTVIQAAKVAPGITKDATNEIDKIAQWRINQIILQGGKEVEHVRLKILRGAIEDVYETPFRLSGNFGTIAKTV